MAAIRNDVERGNGGTPEILGTYTSPFVAVFLLVLQLVFGLTFLVMGSINVYNCNIDQNIPVWLIVQGIVLMMSGVHEFCHFRRTQHKKTKDRSAVSAVISIIITTMLFALFIMGNVVVFRAWEAGPDFARVWWINGCDNATFMLAFSAVIVLNVIVASMVIALIVFSLYVCFCRGKRQ